ncbi:LmeA family phospholipid-binding protein [Aquipuribacter sp. MA13-6]|uniref:LmeA family phospholipid-binding protein n=1 Tax=unclassified Aquipuribacter TaxID=2635084 RepID=UPI003EED01FD
MSEAQDDRTDAASRRTDDASGRTDDAAGRTDDAAAPSAGRTRDRLVGAAIALLGVALVVVVAVVAFAWWVSDPADDGASPLPGTTDGVVTDGATGAATPPSDLGPGETWLGDLVLDAGTVLTTDATLRDVEAVAQDVRNGADGSVVGRLAVEATVPFEVVAAELGEGSTVAAAEDGQASVTRDVEVADRTFTVVATGTVAVARGLIVVEPTAVDIGGPPFLAEVVAAAARELVTIEQEVEGLPEGLVLQDVVVLDDGFRVALDGEDVRIG